MTTLHPRAVSPSSWRAWSLEAFVLVTERWYWHVPLALGLAAATAALPRLFQVVLGVVSLALFALLAQARSERRAPGGVLAGHALALLRIAAGGSMALLATVAVLVALLPGAAQRAPGAAAGAGGSGAAPASALAFTPGTDLLQAAALAVAGPGAIFFLALLLFVRAPLLQALDLSAEAVRLNPFVVGLGLALAALLGLAGGWSGLTVVAALPWAGALLQVAWRDVFLGEAPPQRQQPQRRRAAAGPHRAPTPTVSAGEIGSVGSVGSVGFFGFFGFAGLVRLVGAVSLGALLLASPPARAADQAEADTAAAWTALREGATVLLRHAQAPGGGDPPGWRLDDCRSQRNLDETGRAQARRIGAQFRERGIGVSTVLTSRWCRTRETAALAFPGLGRDEPAFDSFFADPTREPAQTAAARRILQALQREGRPGAHVVVTHQVNISALTGLVPASGEGIVVRAQADGSLAVLGRLPP